MVLGDASYVIYLMHYVERNGLTYVMQHYPVLSRWGSDLPLAVGIAAIVFSGVLFHWWIERPTVRWLHATVGSWNCPHRAAFVSDIHRWLLTCRPAPALARSEGRCNASRYFVALRQSWSCCAT
jgi:peptidoglycan/LPS O-acetylase OafA/YrhL